MSRLFAPWTLRGVTVRNRVFVSPMCMYSSTDGHPTDWHLVHLGSFARGGCGLVMTEATAVVPEGRISPADAGIWTDGQAEDYARITDFVTSQGAVPGIQLAHAGRKASTVPPGRGRGYLPPASGGWQTVGPSAIGYADWPAPRELTEHDIADLVSQFALAAVRAVTAGFRVIEVHAAHGYLLHEFLSPLTNTRSDGYGGDLSGRSRFLLETLGAIRAVVPDRMPVVVRVSATDWADGGWTLEETVELASRFAAVGVDAVDVSSGGNVPQQRIVVGPGYQVPFAGRVRAATGMPTIAVGLITEPTQAEQILADGSADAVMLARSLLRDPHWALRAAHELGVRVDWPEAYERGRWS